MRTRTLPAWLTSRPIAHRGLHSPDAPENTLAAFEAACAAGYPIELDVQLLGDGEPVVFHDGRLDRAVGLARSLDDEDRLSIKKHRLFGTAQTIPTLVDVLDLVSGRVPILLEIKSRHNGVRAARTVLERVARYSGELAVQSFDPYAMATARKHAPDIPRGQLAGPLRHEGLHRIERLASRLLLTAAMSRPHFVNYDLRALPDPWVHALTRALRLPVLGWTVRSEADRTRAESLGINYVFDHVRP